MSNPILLPFDMSQIQIKSTNLEAAEVSWFAPICDGDDRYLGARDPLYSSNWEHTSQVAITADRLGYRNILCPSSYQAGQDTLSFAAALAPLTQQINMLTAVRCGEVHPPMLARALSTLDHLLKGRLTVNIISSDLPGTQLPSADRYQRSREVIEILKQAWTKAAINFKGQFYEFSDLPTAPVRPYQINGGPLLYFGGYSPPGVELCAEHCDVYLMWPETETRLAELMTNMSVAAARHGRTVDFGLRVHVIVRETETEAKQAARDLMSGLDAQLGEDIRGRAQDAKSYGVARQSEMREQSDDDGFVEDQLWTGIGRARSGCGAAIVGDPDQVFEKLRRYHAMGIRAFILSGYPHREECELFGKYVLPRIKTCSMPEVSGRRPKRYQSWERY